MAASASIPEPNAKLLGGFARGVLWANLVAALLAGLALYPLATRADTDFAWSIRLPLTAAFLGAGYWGSSVGLVLATRVREWQRLRILFVTGFVLTLLMLAPTLAYLEQFHLDDGSSTARAVAWFWVVLYFGQPWLLLAALIVEERNGGRLEYGVVEPLLPWVRIVLLVHAVGLAAAGVAVWPVRADAFWAWPLPDLAAGAVAVFLAAFAAGAAWCLRERDWRRCRLVFPPYLSFLALVLIALARFSDELDGGRWQTWTFVAALLGSIASLSLALLRQERVRIYPARLAL